MNKMSTKWLKYIDFIVLDFVVLQAAFFIAYSIRHGYHNLMQDPRYFQTTSIIMIMCLLTVFFFECYREILKRGYWKEWIAVIKQNSCIFAGSITYKFIAREAENSFRETMLLWFVLSVLLLYGCRILYKEWRKGQQKLEANKKAIMLITMEENAEQLLHKFSNPYGEYTVIGIGILDLEEEPMVEINGIPKISGISNIMEGIKTLWVDEVLFCVPKSYEVPKEMLEKCLLMGIVIHMELEHLQAEFPNQRVERLEGTTVLSSSIQNITTRQAFCKRVMDIAGAIVGLLITLLLAIVIGPMIYVKSPGSIIFQQDRIGKNGRRFKIYKFRSMYKDAEQQKAQLMEQNQANSNLIFKMEDDPRILPGIGHFIRKHSIDEFPQFLNVLKGEMSLVGTRPPTVDEWEQYDYHHRGRMAIKPGITGLWQVSGRNEIKDFEKIVELDLKYITEWNIGKDIKILLQTIIQMFHTKGSM